MARRCGLVVMSVACVGALLAAAACSDAPTTAETLPPIATTTTTTTTIATTTTVQRYYEVQQGDTLFKIAQRFGVSLEALIALNGITNPDRIEAGQELEIPPATVVVPLPAASTTSSTSAGASVRSTTTRPGSG